MLKKKLFTNYCKQTRGCYSKWKPILSQQRGQTSVYQIVKIDSASFYCNTMCSTLLYCNKTIVLDWQDKMRSGLNNFNINDEPLEFSEC